MASSQDRIELRAPGDVKRKLQAAAALRARSVSDLILDAANREAAIILADDEISKAARQVGELGQMRPGEKAVFRLRGRTDASQTGVLNVMACVGYFDITGAFTEIGCSAWTVLNYLSSLVSPSGIFAAEDPEAVRTLMLRLGGVPSRERAQAFRHHVERELVNMGLASEDNGEVVLFVGELAISERHELYYWSRTVGGATGVDNLDPHAAALQIVRFAASQGFRPPNGTFAPPILSLEIPFNGSEERSSIGFVSHGNDRYAIIGPNAAPDVSFKDVVKELEAAPRSILRAQLFRVQSEIAQLLAALPPAMTA